MTVGTKNVANNAKINFIFLLRYKSDPKEIAQIIYPFEIIDGHISTAKFLTKRISAAKLAQNIPIRTMYGNLYKGVLRSAGYTVAFFEVKASDCLAENL